MSNILCLYTASFPYGNKEAYLEYEIKVLSTKFNHIYLFPLYTNSEVVREVPLNCEVREVLLPKNTIKRLFLSLLGFIRLLTLPKQLYAFFSELKIGFQSSGIHWIKFWLKYLLDHFVIIHKARKLERSVENIDAVHYFYWGLGYSDILLYWRKQRSYIRFHGGDVFLDRGCGYIPFFRRKLELAKSLAISKVVKRLLTNESMLSYLGTVQPPNFKPNFAERFNAKHILVISNLVESKRVDLVLQLLVHLIDFKLTIVGDGSERDTLEKFVFQEKLEDRVTFLGSIPNFKVHHLLLNHNWTYLVSFSKAEGLPVSYMEAMSYGIPCVVSDVGATMEIVSDINGILFKVSSSPLNIAQRLLSISVESYVIMSTSARVTWEHHFQGKINYSSLALCLKS